MLVLAGIVLLPALLPIAATDHSVKLNSTNPNETTMAELDQFSMGHVGVSFAFFFFFSSVTFTTYELII